MNVSLLLIPVPSENTPGQVRDHLKNKCMRRQKEEIVKCMMMN
jgi:hypothetical protein